MSEDASKIPAEEAEPQAKEELSNEELDAVSGGALSPLLKTASGGIQIQSSLVVKPIGLPSAMQEYVVNCGMC